MAAATAGGDNGEGGGSGSSDPAAKLLFEALDTAALAVHVLRAVAQQASSDHSRRS
jgi:hypothetical protein